MIDCILYTRVSTDKQDMERQDYLLPLYCQKADLRIVARFSDPATSGSMAMKAREGGERMLAEIAQRASAGPLAFVTTDQDRIGRDLLDIVSTIREIWKTGTIPHFAAECGPLPRTAENELVLGVKASSAQYMRDKIIQNIRGKLTAKRAAGELTGTVPYGWNAVATGAVTAKGVKVRRIEDNPDEQKWILHMHRLKLAGWGYGRIASELNRLGVPTKRGAGEVMRLRKGNLEPLNNRTIEPSNADPVQGSKFNVQGSTVAPGKSSLRFTRGKWQCGNVQGVLTSATVVAWLKAETLKTETLQAA